MSTVIDSLLMELGLDNKKFKAGMKESEKVQDAFQHKVAEHSKESEKQSNKEEIERKRRHNEQVKQHKETLENYKKMREDLIKFFLIFTAGKEIGEFISETVRSGMEMGQLAEKTDVAVESIAGLQVAFKEIGGGADEANNAIAKVAAANADFKEGRNNAMNTELYTAASGTHVDLSGAHQDPLAMMRAQADIIKEVYNSKAPNMGHAVAAQRAERMGVTGHLFDLMKDGADEFMKRIAHGAAMSGMNKHKTEQTAEFNRVWVDLLEKLQSVGRDVLIPVLTELTKWLGSKENIQKFNDALTGVVNFLKNVDWKAVGEDLQNFGSAVMEFALWVGNLVGYHPVDKLNKNIDGAIKSVLPEGLVRMYDELNVLSGYNKGELNKDKGTITYHIGTLLVEVPKDADKRTFGLAVSKALQANSN